MKINQQELYKLYMIEIEKIADDLDWKTSFSPQEIIHIMSCILESNPHLITHERTH